MRLGGGGNKLWYYYQYVLGVPSPLQDFTGLHFIFENMLTNSGSHICLVGYRPVHRTLLWNVFQYYGNLGSINPHMPLPVLNVREENGYLYASGCQLEC